MTKPLLFQDQAPVERPFEALSLTQIFQRPWIKLVVRLRERSGEFFGTERMQPLLPTRYSDARTLVVGGV